MCICMCCVWGGVGGEFIGDADKYVKVCVCVLCVCARDSNMCICIELCIQHTRLGFKVCNVFVCVHSFLTHACMCVFTHLCLNHIYSSHNNMYIFEDTFGTCLPNNIYIYIHTNKHTYIHTYIHTYVCVYIHIYQRPLESCLQLT
jgi:hypothetical protein